VQELDVPVYFHPKVPDRFREGFLTYSGPMRIKWRRFMRRGNG
jgi:hypothetical protein